MQRYFLNDRNTYLFLQPVRPNSETTNSLHVKLNRYRKRRAQSSNSNNNKNLCERANRRESRIEDKDLSYKCNNDSATNSFISEDTNLSSTSTCSNNNNNLDAINGKRCRSLSKTSEESTLSNAKSSGYDTNTSSDNRSLDDDDVKVFKGFSNVQDDTCKIEVINEMLDDLKSKIDEDGKTSRCKDDIKSRDLTSQEDFKRLCKKTASACVETTLTVKKEERDERSIDTLTSVSKTDDEKLNEIISAESSRLPTGVCSTRVSVSDNVGDNISTSSKSDDEKLSETNISTSCKKNGVNKNITFNGSRRASLSNNASLREKVTRRKNKDVSPSNKSNNSTQERSPGKRQLRSRYRATQHNTEDKTEETKTEAEKQVKLEDDDEEMTSSACVAQLEEAVDNDSDDYATSDNGYNLRRSNRLKTDECKEHFNKLLSDLSVSDFQLVVDSVDGLRDLISSFTEADSKGATANIVSPISFLLNIR